MTRNSEGNMENSTVSCYEKHSDAYDIYQPAVVPYYQDMLQIVASTVARNLGGKKETLKILDLGCGTGNAPAAVLRTLPAKVFLLDGSGNMVEAATDKISKSWPDAIIGRKAADISSDDWDIGLEKGGYDAIISTLVLEHLPLDRYRIAIDKCFNLLKHEGWIIAVEGYEENGCDLVGWLSEQMEENRSRLPTGMSDFVAILRRLNEVHYYTSKSQKEAWWREAGLVNVHVIWQYLCMALMVGRKP